MLVLESNEQNSVLGASFWVSPAAELRLPSVIALQGPDNKIAGTIFSKKRMFVTHFRFIIAG